MSKEIKRSVKTAQLKMREINITLDGIPTDPFVSGFDKNSIQKVIKAATGQYEITLKRPFNLENQNGPLAFVQPITAGIITNVVATDSKTIVIDCADLAGTLTDCQLMIKITGCDHRFNY